MQTTKILLLTIFFWFYPPITRAVDEYIPPPRVKLRIDFVDFGCGMGPGSLMELSNDGFTWSPPRPYALIVDNWDLSLYGGSYDPETITVYVRTSDSCGNWTKTIGPAEIDIDITPPIGTLKVVDINDDPPIQPNHPR